MRKKFKLFSSVLAIILVSSIILYPTITYAKSEKLNWNSKYDVNNDLIINEADINELSKHYNEKKDSPNWNSKYDINNDGIIDIFDIVKVSKYNGVSASIKPIEEKSMPNLSGKGVYLKELLNSNNNVTITKDTSNNPIFNVWVKGIIPPTESDFTSLDLGGNYMLKVVPWKRGQGWYDINKVRKNSGDDFLCSGAVATNMLHWWLDQNKDYVDKYLKQNIENGKSYNKHWDIRDTSTFYDQQNSGIFNLIKKFYGHQGKGIWPDRTLLWYINGYTLEKGRWEQELPKNIDGRGGFFYNVFKTKNLTDETNVSQYETFNMRLLQWLKGDVALGISHKTMAINSHIITVWGASFDKNGNLIGVYTTDSDDEDREISKDNLFGMRYSKVNKDSQGLARISNLYTNDVNVGARTLRLYSLRLGKEEWKNYFNEHK